MSQQTSKEWAQRYINEGWSPIPIPKGEKGPRISGWEQQDFTAADFSDDDNIGVHLGKGQPGLYDVDIDDKAAVIAADILLASTNRIHGRPGKPRSHRFYTCHENIDHYVVHGLGGSNDTIIELRGISPTSRAYTQTVLPPSVHPSGEQLAWVEEGKPGDFALAAPFILQVRDVGIATLFARAFPGAGHRHEPRLALAGFLYRAHPDEGWVKAIGRAVMQMTGGSEQDWLDVARTTIAKLKSDPEATVTGGAKLKELLVNGEAVIKKVNLLLGRQDQAAVDEVIERYNRRYFIVTAGVTPCVADDSEPHGIKLYTYDAFRKTKIKERMPTRKGKDKIDKKTGQVIKGKDREGKPCAEVWLEHKDGRIYENLVYAPPPLTCGPHDYNGWKGFACAPVEGAFPLIEHHVRDIMCGGDDEVYGWFMNWCAALVQEPGNHAVTGVVAQGGQGVGKGFVFHDLLGKMFDMRHYICISSSEQFYGRFAGELLSGRCLTFLDEATWGGDKRDMGTLKDRVTGDYLIVDRKNISQVHERSMMHLCIASNEDWPIGVDADDRRFTVLKVVNPHANDPNYFGPLYEELENGGRGAFLYALMNMTIDREALRKPIDTDAKRDLKVRSLPADAEWWQDKLTEGRLLPNDKGWPGHVVRSALHADYLQYVQNVGSSRRLGPQGLAKRLKLFCPTIGAMKPHGKPRVWVLPSLDKVRAAFEKFLKAPIDWEADNIQATLPDDESDDVPF